MEVELLIPMVEQTGWRGSEIEELNGDDREQLSIESLYAGDCCW